MESDLTIRTLTNADPNFYPLLGRFLSRRAIVADIGGPVWDDDGKTWWVALAGDRVVGFCAATAGDPVTLQSAWVEPGTRRRQVYRRLFAARLAWLGDRAARARVTQASAPVFARHGFVEHGRHGRFVEMRRP